MNDRLKIRVWDKVYENYWKEEEVYENIQWLLYPDDDNINNVVIEQCTGVHGKNGKLIYEGDLLRLSIYECVQDELFAVEDLRSFFFLLDKEYPFDVTNNDWEVVGNIHENEELLKAEKKALQNDIKEIFEEVKAMSKDLSKDGNKCIKCGARADRITINYDYICPDCRRA